MFEEQLRMAKMGIKEMMIGVAYSYEFGMGTAKNKEEAIKWYEKAGDSESVGRAKDLKQS